MMRPIYVLGAMALCSCALSQNKLSEFYQFRKLSGLPGSGFGVTIDGYPDVAGAMSFSTPIGYSLRGGTFEIGIGSRSNDLTPRFINTNSRSNNSSSGTAQIMAGLSTNFGNFTYSVEAVSYYFDTLNNVQWQLPIKSKELGVSVGVQNWQNRPAGGKYSSRSFYAVGTYEYQKGDHVSLGFGDARFHGPFANTDYLVNNKLKATLEFDTFVVSPGLAYSFGKVKGLGDNFDRNDVSMFCGLYAVHYLQLGASWAF